MSRQQGFIEVEFNGENKLLRFDFNALADLEDHFNIGIANIMSEQRIGFSTIRALYWAGLKWKDKGLTLERAGAMIQNKMNDGANFEELLEPIVKALQASGLMGKKENTEDEPKN